MKSFSTRLTKGFDDFTGNLLKAFFNLEIGLLFFCHVNVGNMERRVKGIPNPKIAVFSVGLPPSASDPVSRVSPLEGAFGNREKHLGQRRVWADRVGLRGRRRKRDNGFEWIRKETPAVRE